MQRNYGFQIHVSLRAAGGGGQRGWGPRADPETPSSVLVPSTPGENTELVCSSQAGVGELSPTTTLLLGLTSD